jgi:hypothetical protein
MSRRRWALGLSVAAATLAAPAPASADMQVVLRQLAEQRLSPPPLVPTTAPRSLRPIDNFIGTFNTPRGYGIDIGAAIRGRLHALVSLTGGLYPSTRVGLRRIRGTGYRARSTRVRGLRGYVLTRRARRETVLLWSEGGVVYTLYTRTPRTVSLSELRATAAGLDRLVGVFRGSAPGDDTRNFADAWVGATSRTVTVDVEFRGPCVLTESNEPGGSFDGVAGVSVMPRQGDNYSFDIAPNLDQERSGFPWQGTVSGAVSASGATLDMRAMGSNGEYTCDTGPVSVTLRPFP